MKVFDRISEGLDLRPEETRLVWLCFAGAFLVVGYMVFARSLREALFLDAFSVKSLPYITVAVVGLSFPVSGIFSHFLARHEAQSILRKAALISLAGLAVLWPVAQVHSVTIVVFYLWTALTALVLTAGFWIIVAEHFPVRGAKRLYGFISAGGTAGALVMGTALKPLTKTLPVWELLPFLIGLVALFWAVLWGLPKLKKAKVSSSSERPSLHEQVSLVLHSPHLFTIAIIIVSATLASTLLDFQFKEFVKVRLQDKSTMAGFLGAFYGWTGGISLLIQIFITSRLMSKFGVAVALSVLPLILIGGATTLLFIISSFTLVTVTRGADNSLRKSLHRSAIEVLYLPVHSLTRRKTKTFIDSVLDAFAEGLGAVVIFFWVTLGNLPSRYLSAFILASALVLLYQVRRMNRQYYRTLEERLKEGDDAAPEEAGENGYGQDLLDASLSSVDLKETLKRKRGIVFEKWQPRERPAPAPTVPDRKIQEVLENGESEDVLRLVRSLKEDASYSQVSRTLAGMGDKALKPLAQGLLDENEDPVIRRRIPRILARIPSQEVEQSLLAALSQEQFEIRYRAAIALLKRMQAGLYGVPKEESDKRLWEAVRFEVGQQRPVWEMQKILDQLEDEERDDFPQESLEALGSLSLEHLFRLLAMILDPKLVKAAYRALKASDEKLKSFALEYLDHVLPDEVKEKLWPFIGDVSAKALEKEIRPLEVVARELLDTEAALLGDKKATAQLAEAVEAVKNNEQKEEEKEEKTKIDSGG